MKKFIKIVGGLLVVLVIAIVAFIIYFNSTYPKVNPPINEKVEITPARFARGEYLANNVTVCMDCHSTRDWNKYSGPITPGTLGKGGDRFGEEMGLPGTIYAKNITPASLKNWTDGELIRAITCGVNKDGNTFFPLMPYLNYNKMTKEDLYSIIAYVRSLQPIESKMPESELNFPLNFIVKTIPPESYNPSPEPDKNNPKEYGKYLVNIAGCFDCHTESDKGEYNMSKSYAGGGKFQLPGGILLSSNITPDVNTGIGNWTKEQFIARFKSMDPDSTQPAALNIMEDYNTAMPWTMYAGMSKEDLSAVYEYLRSVKPISNSVTRWTPNKHM